MPDNLVGYSRAGDVFHYRWAARRSMRLLYPNSSLVAINIEGSQEKKKAGEYVIDVSEYYKRDDKRSIQYYQLKHTTVQSDNPFKLSNLKSTFIGFAERYLQHFGSGTTPLDAESIVFTIITNRKFDDVFKTNILNLANGHSVNTRFLTTIEKYTKLSNGQLRHFCSLLEVEDGEGDYELQKEELRIEIAQILAGNAKNHQIETITALIQEKVLPKSDGKIVKEDILKRFGITSERQLYPAPTLWENLDKIIKRPVHESLMVKINDSKKPIIVHASGGVGKSVFTRQFVSEIDHFSVAIAYDCFGLGTYRNRSTPRHRHRDALVQIANELATKGLCEPLLVENNSLDDEICRTFLKRLQRAITSLKEVNPDAKLYILIDAADNAEMAAKEFSQSCFVNEILAESYPDDCKLIMLCRTERIHLLQPKSYVLQVELPSFSKEETHENLKSHFTNCTQQDSEEFHRLTGGNPRVQANALDTKAPTIQDLLATLGPAGTSVEDQIKSQLNHAVSKLKDNLPPEFVNQIDSICSGLASLPPHIPISTLAKASAVEVDAVKSFVSDIGRALWLTDNSIQFRDEPTETWFRQTYLATKLQVEKYLELLEPLAPSEAYVAEALPQLYLQAEQYDKLIQIALSDKFLPNNNPIDARNVRVYRLQFAFKAALKSEKYKDAVQLAMRAGEEVAGDQRQLNLFKKNIDLLVALQSNEKVQEIAYRRLLSGQWSGSENAYSASLLSGIEEFKGEGRSYLRAAMHWLEIYFEESRNSKENHFNHRLENEELLEIAYAHLNIIGVDASLAFLNWITPKKLIVPVVMDLMTRLIDLGKFDVIDEFLNKCSQDVHFNVAIVSTLLEIGYIPKSKQIEQCLILLTDLKTGIEVPQRFSFNDRLTSAIVSFLEVCLANKLDTTQILTVLGYYVPDLANQQILSTHDSKERALFLRSLAIRSIIKNKEDVDYESILPKVKKEKKDGSNEDDRTREYKEFIGGLFPWYLLRAKVISGQTIKLNEFSKEASEKSHQARAHRYSSYDTIPFEIANICVSIFIHAKKSSEKEIKTFYTSFIKEDKGLYVQDRIFCVRAAFRLKHLSFINAELEKDCFEIIKSINDGPENISERYVGLARAVVINSKADSSFYFEEAIEVVSKFGDELNERWYSIISIAIKATESSTISDEIAYRFIRIAELVGENTEEKYWDRENAIAVCSQISHCASIAALSRWRDRDIGYFDKLLESLISRLLVRGVLSVTTAWSLTKLLSRHHLNELLESCFKIEQNSEVSHRILKDAVNTLRQEGSPENYFEELKEITDKYNVNNDDLTKIVSNYLVRTPKQIKERPTALVEVASTFDWNAIFEGLSIVDSEGIQQAYTRTITSEVKNKHYVRHEFWKEVFKRIGESEAITIIDIFLDGEFGDFYDARDFFTSLPKEWRDKVGFKKKWPEMVFKMGKKYAYSLTDKHSLTYFANGVTIAEEHIPLLKDGLFKRFESGNDFNNASMFFGFVALATSKITIAEAGELLKYCLERIELHVEDDFGDGKWNEWLEVANDVNQSIARFLWCSLGSPRNAFRWKAVHCIKALYENKDLSIIDEIIECIDSKSAEAYGSISFPFYYLHAQLYLLIALARVSIDCSEHLVKHSSVFSKYALCQHVLIQKYASEVVVNIETKYPGTYDAELYKSIIDISKSKFPVLDVPYDYSTDSVWHTNNEVEKNTEFHFGWDFDRYWFEPLSRVFGLPEKQIEDLAADVILNEWGVTEADNGYKNDPRERLWRSHSSERETWHDHGSYPRADNLDFYHSYHSMLVVASKLHARMPVISNRDYEEDKWVDWLSYHLTTREDGKWLSDARDSVPIARPEWTNTRINGSLKEDHWRKDINAESFINTLFQQVDDVTWMVVKGGWHEISEHRKESCTVTSALIGKEAASSLMQALTNCPDPYDYKLPDYQEEDMEFAEGPFQLKGWIESRDVSKGMDKFDPYANEIQYPPYVVGEEMQEKLQLTLDAEGKNYYLSNDTNPSIVSEMWNSFKYSRDDENDQTGNCTKATLAILKDVCKAYDCEMIFEVSIKREFTYKYRDKEEERTKSIHKLFILSQDGQLRDAEGNITVR